MSEHFQHQEYIIVQDIWMNKNSAAGGKSNIEKFVIERIEIGHRQHPGFYTESIQFTGESTPPRQNFELTFRLNTSNGKRT